ncbi:sulfotransferase [uncultured Porticoccus sp.]|uniref:sulfotransferase family protein n=1 Tax=uncultured Porticoccus sp. TaxID=1256050 RepID=UPI0030DD53E2|tara:strand:+ start:173 stop:1051 length:879 start_codon:yes stop_codon:yes gene_type:complete
MMLNEFRKSPFLIIGGAPRSGTTALFRYLSDHPQVSAALTKEVRFFVDSDCPGPRFCYFEEGLESYAKYFLNHGISENKTLLEASPDYLYSKTALHIPSVLPNAKMVFVLRDPIERLVSCFRYAKQRGVLSQNLSFDEYVEKQLLNKVVATTPLHYRALEWGRYDHYLAAFRGRMGSRMMTVEFSELRSNPELVMAGIAKFAKLSPGFYKNYSFEIENDSHNLRFKMLDKTYRGLRHSLQHVLPKKGFLWEMFKWSNQNVLKKMLSFNKTAMEKVVISDSVREKLENYYQLP